MGGEEAVSIHAPARGATVSSRSRKRTSCSFQSTRPRGARPALPCARRDGSRVSIHAPARGATPKLGLPSSWPIGFNPRAREGRDWRCNTPTGTSRCFNPRAREGRDRLTRPIRITRPCFNPRAREGRDYRYCLQRAVHKEFQSTRPRGARPARHTCSQPRRTFQSTRPRGARRPVLHVLHDDVDVSIHAPARGATRRHLRASDPRIVSIHAPARGATRRGRSLPSAGNCFNPRAREGRDIMR